MDQRFVLGMQASTTYDTTTYPPQTVFLIILCRRRTARLEHTLFRPSSEQLLSYENRRRASVISNLTLPIASPSAIAKYEASDGWPTIEANVSRCW